MCGIVGIAMPPGRPLPPEETLHAMCDTILHRGPDSEGFDARDGVFLGMRRLAIIDVAGGSQPLWNEDRTVRVVFNGEIYNFPELRRDLENRGHRLASGSDGEVIAHLWEEHGAEFPRRLNGMFAIALHDRRQKKLLLVRDRLGIKPLFFSLEGGLLVFGSELKALLASGLVERRLDTDALGQYLSWEYVPGDQTLVRSVRKLEPGGRLELDLESGEHSRHRWWDLAAEAAAKSDEESERSDAEWEEAIDAKIRQCVQRQLISDVPLGAFLSGGVDSSLVVAGMGGARTFSIGFDDPSYNELAWARRAADHLGVSHEQEVITPRVLELFDHLMRFLDDPIGDFSIFPTYLVSRLARREVTVVLSGDGGDEVFGGYETYLAQAGARFWDRLPRFLRRGVIEPIASRIPPQAKKKGLVNKIKRFVEGAAHPAELGHARWRLFASEALRRELFTEEALGAMATPVGAHIIGGARSSGFADPVDRALGVDLGSYLVDNCLVKVDRMSMACSLEARVPLLDHELVELAFRMPSRLKVARGRTKVLLKRVAARHVPRACVYRPKEGFSIPIKNWLRAEFRPLMEELLATDRIRSEGIFRADIVDRLRREHLEGRENHSHVLWAMLVFEDWRRRWSV